MAKDKVRKGFFFYFGFFLLIILAVVLIIFVVMMFMPGTSILGLEYFSSSANAAPIVQTNDGNEIAIDFENPTNFSSVEIDAGYSEVIVQKNKEYVRDGIYILNNSKGFVTSKKASKFSYSVTIDNGVLKISVKEQDAFLYFSKDVKIILQVSNENINPFRDKKITIRNTDGSVNIGGGYNAGRSSSLEIKSLEIDNKKGGINFSKLAPSAYEELKLKTTSGDINISHDLTVSARLLSIESGSGNIDAKTLYSVNPILLGSDSGKITVSTVDGNLAPRLKNAYVEIGKVTGNIDFSSSNDTFASSVVKINEVDGAIDCPNAKGTRFELNLVRGAAKIETSTGDIVISQPVVNGSALKTNSGKIEASVGEGAGVVSAVSEKGTINLKLPKSFGNVIVSNEKGTTNLSLDDNSGYSVVFTYYGSDDPTAFKFDNVKLNKTLPQGQEITNPLNINGGGSQLNLHCNKAINFDWRQSA